MAEIDIESPASQGRRLVSGALLQTMQESIDVLDLNVRSYNAANRANIGKIAELAAKTEAELLADSNFGRKAVNNIKEALTPYGLTLGSKFYERQSGRELPVGEVLRIDPIPQIQAERSNAAAAMARDVNEQLRSEIAHVFRQAGEEAAWPMPEPVQRDLVRRLKLARALDEYTKG